HQLEKDGCAEIVQRQIAHFIDHQHLGREIDTHAAIESTFSIGAAEIGDQIMRGDEVGAETGLNGSFSESHAEMRFADTRWSQENYIAALVNEAQRAEFTDLALIDRRLEGEVELIEVLQVRQVCQLQTRPQI